MFVVKNFITGILIFCTGILFSQSSLKSGALSENYDMMNDADTSGIVRNYSGFRSWDLVINELMTINQTSFSDEAGEYDDWIELFNYGSDTIDLTGSYLTDDSNDLTKFRIDSVIKIPPGDFIILWADDNISAGKFHLGFNLAGDNGFVGILSPDTQMIDLISYGNQVVDISFGRNIDGSPIWNYFNVSTPGFSNSLSTGLVNITQNPVVDIPGGFYQDSVVVNLIVAPNQTVYFTLDNSEPDLNSNIFDSSLTINVTSTLRLRAYRTNYLPSAVVSNTYFINYDSSLPVLSMITDDDNLYGASGIYSHPTNGLEKPVHIEYFEADGSYGFSVDAGMKIHAPDTKPQKAFRFYARSQYGYDEIDYQIFKDKNIDSFKRLVLRNAGNDGIQVAADRTNLRDPLMHIASSRINTTVGYSSSNSVNVYLNGEYWGMYNLRERIDKYYFEENNNYPADMPMDLLERTFGYPSNRYAMEGSWTDALNLELYCDTADLNVISSWNYVNNLLDVENFTDYWIIETYFGNFDWLTNNIKLWRPLNPPGKFKWALWDMDHGLGLPYLTYGDPEWNTLYWGTSSDMGGRPDYGQNTRIIRGLLTNDDYEEHFIIRFADLINSYLSENSLLEIIDSVYNLVQSDMTYQIDKWGSGTMSNWEDAIQTVRDYVTVRDSYVRDHIKQKFGLDTMITLSLDVFPADAGIIELNTITVSSFPWAGLYYLGMENRLTAIPKPGYEFVGWQNTGIDTSFVSVVTIGDTSLVAIFQPQTSFDTTVVINEINYHSAAFWDTKDWVEFYNPSSYPIDISDWTFYDEDFSHSFTFPAGTIIPPDKYLVLSEDTASISIFFPQIEYLIGNMTFALSNSGEPIRLYNNAGFIKDSVFYLDNTPWPPEADGYGPTLTLIDPFLDNALYSSWMFSENPYGSPGSTDSIIMINHEMDDYNLNLNIYPNPCKGNTVLVFENPENQNINLKISDITGNIIETLYNGSLEKGEFTFKMGISSYQSVFSVPGIYLVVLETESSVIVRKLLLL